MKVLLLSLVFLFFSPAWIYWYQDTVLLGPTHELPDVDAIVVLTGGRGRIKYASHLWAQYYLNAAQTKEARVPYFYISGLGKTVRFKDIQEFLDPQARGAMTERWLKVDTESRDTYQNALYFSQEQKKQNWQSIVLVTSSYHLKRAAYMFQKAVHSEEFLIETYSLKQESYTLTTWFQTWNGIQVSWAEFVKYLYFRLGGADELEV